MCLHVFQTLVEVREHVGELFGAYKVGGTGSVQSAGHGFEVGVVLEVVVHVLSQIRDATLFGHE